MDKELLSQRMLEFIETQDGDYFDEWYASPREFAAVILSDFAKHLGFALEVPPYVPRKSVPQVNRGALLQELLPELSRVLNAELDMRGYK
jgi:hypothetical protein